jgi:hypothetical protein
MAASEVFEGGEPIMVVGAAGTAVEPVGATTSWPLTEFTSGVEAGIACFGPGDGTKLNPATGVAFATGDDIAYWPINEGNLFITDNFFETGDTTTLATPAQTDVGYHYKMNQAVLNTAWGIEQTVGAPGVDVLANVVEVLDADKVPIRLSGQTGVSLVFHITATLAGV